MSNDDGKIAELLAFATSLSPRQRIVYSDEGNLKMPSNIGTETQSSYPDCKPRGLWYGFGGSWVDWLNEGRKEAPEGLRQWCQKILAKITHVYQISLNYNCVERIRTEAEFDTFHEMFSAKRGHAIKWGQVEEQRAGIEIRLIHSRCEGERAKKNWDWYYDWDVSSGCIWHRYGIRRIKLLRAWERKWVAV